MRTLSNKVKHIHFVLQISYKKQSFEILRHEKYSDKKPKFWEEEVAPDAGFEPATK